MRAAWWLAAFALWTTLVATGLTTAADGGFTWPAALDPDGFWRSWTHIGDTVVLAMATVGIAAFWLIERRPHTARHFVLLMLLTGILVFLLKVAIGRPRPEGALEDGFAYPSGHTTLSMVFFVAWARLGGATRRVVIAAALVGASLGLSRLALAVHHPSDVVGGWLLAAALLALSTRTVAPSAR